MPILINDAILSTEIFCAIFILAIFASLRRKKDSDLFPLSVTRELKGLAILAIIFSHIGYFLVTDHRFLFPLSVMAGTGVNLFLFLSGFGLTMSSLRKKLPLGKFYRKHFLKLFIPFWIAIAIFFLLDFFLLQRSYSSGYIIQSMLGFFPTGDLFRDVNSPFWFLTPLLFYYLIFPLVFMQKRSWLTAIIVGAISFFILQLRLPVSTSILQMYQMHFLAFPLGIAFASLFFEPYYLSRFEPAKIKTFLYNLERPIWLKATLDKFRAPNIFHRVFKKLSRPVYFAILAALLIFIGYFSYYSQVGGVPWHEQGISLLVMIAIIFFFILKKMEIKLFYLFGFYSYEIYLIHWPLLSRYDIFFKYLPAWLAMILYLALFLLISWPFEKLLCRIHRLKMLK
jgi:peptidoglycan/LPS O-acetylase OafA/YrhL